MLLLPTGAILQLEGPNIQPRHRVKGQEDPRNPKQGWVPAGVFIYFPLGQMQGDFCFFALPGMVFAHLPLSLAGKPPLSHTLSLPNTRTLMLQGPNIPDPTK